MDWIRTLEAFAVYAGLGCALAVCVLVLLGWNWLRKLEDK